MNKYFKSRAFRQGSVATAITAVFIALIVALNMLATTVSSKYSLSLDLTANKIFGVSDVTKDFLASLDKDVNIYVLSPEETFITGGDYFVQANEVVKQYGLLSPRITVQYIDLIRNTVFATRFPDLQLLSDSIVVACGDKAVDLTPYELYNIEADYDGNAHITSSKAEQAMTSAILKVTSDKTTRAVFLTGHDEMPLAGLKSLLEMNDYEVVEQNLLTEEIDSEATLAVLCAPMRDLSDEELDRLDNFLDNGGKFGRSLYYFASDIQPDLPKLSVFLSDWGVGVGDGVVFEASFNRVFNMNMLRPVVDYTENVYARPALERSLLTLAPYSRPLSVLFESKSNISVQTLLEFSQTSGILPADAPEGWQPVETDLIGPMPAMILSQKAEYNGGDMLVSNVVACGSAIAVEDSHLASTSIGNSEYFLNLINTLSDRDDVVSIQSKTIGGNELGIQSLQAVLLGIIFAVVLPLAVLVFGAIVWLSRRHR